MRYSIPMKIVDRDSILSELDLHQLENMIWLRLAPSKSLVDWVKVEVLSIGDEEYGRGHLIKSVTYLASGVTVRSTTTRVSKGAALIASVDLMKERVDAQLQTEARWSYRFANRFRGVLRNLRRVLVNVAGLRRPNSRSASS